MCFYSCNWWKHANSFGPDIDSSIGYLATLRAGLCIYCLFDQQEPQAWRQQQRLSWSCSDAYMLMLMLMLTWPSGNTALNIFCLISRNLKRRVGAAAGQAGPRSRQGQCIYYCMSKKSWLILCSKFLYIDCHDLYRFIQGHIFDRCISFPYPALKWSGSFL